MTSRCPVGLACLALMTSLAACPKPAPVEPVNTDSGAHHAVPAVGNEKQANDGIKAVFDASAPKDPRATTLCSAIYDTPATKKAACCSQPSAPNPLTQTCAGLLSSALALKAVTLDDTNVKACVSARDKQLDGCKWIGPLTPLPPAPCGDVVHGDADDGAKCRSSLECKIGLRCHGAGPLDAGRCGPPLADGSRCGGAVDGLAAVVNQTAIDDAHRECAGTCQLGRCSSPRKAGEQCMSDAQCGDGNRCDGTLCASGRIAIGQPCKTAGCVDGARCRDGACQPLHHEGEACTIHFDCAEGGCLMQPGAKSGVCGMQCVQ